MIWKIYQGYGRAAADPEQSSRFSGGSTAMPDRGGVMGVQRQRHCAAQ